MWVMVLWMRVCLGVSRCIICFGGAVHINFMGGVHIDLGRGAYVSQDALRPLWQSGRQWGQWVVHRSTSSGPWSQALCR